MSVGCGAVGLWGWGLGAERGRANTERRSVRSVLVRSGLVCFGYGRWLRRRIKKGRSLRSAPLHATLRRIWMIDDVGVFWFLVEKGGREEWYARLLSLSLLLAFFLSFYYLSIHSCAKIHCGPLSTRSLARRWYILILGKGVRTFVRVRYANLLLLFPHLSLPTYRCVCAYS